MIEEGTALRVLLGAALEANGLSADAPQGYMLASCTDGLFSHGEVAAVRPALIVVDLDYARGPSSLAICRILRDDEALASTGILATGSSVERGFEYVVLLNGADLFVHREDLSAEVLLCNLLALHQAKRRVRATRLHFGALSLCRRTERLWLDGDPIDLPAGAFALMLKLMSSVGGVVSHHDLAALPRTADLSQAQRISKVHVCRLRRALGEHAPLVETVRGRGYRLRKPGS